MSLSLWTCSDQQDVSFVFLPLIGYGGCPLLKHRFSRFCLKKMKYIKLIYVDVIPSSGGQEPPSLRVAALSPRACLGLQELLLKPGPSSSASSAEHFITASPSLCGPNHPKPSPLGQGWVIMEPRSHNRALNHSPF